MKRNWLGYLGFLGLLGLLGLYTGNVGFYGFFGFFGWFGFFAIVNDERMVENVNRACRNAFITSLFFAAVVIPAGELTRNPGVFVAGFALNFALSVIVFTVSLQIYDKTSKE